VGSLSLSLSLSLSGVLYIRMHGRRIGLRVAGQSKLRASEFRRAQSPSLSRSLARSLRPKVRAFSFINRHRRVKSLLMIDFLFP
jgi:hypothetical protein